MFSSGTPGILICHDPVKDDGAIIPFFDCIVIAIHDFSQWIISWGASIAMSGSKKEKKKTARNRRVQTSRANRTAEGGVSPLVAKNHIPTDRPLELLRGTASNSHSHTRANPRTVLRNNCISFHQGDKLASKRKQRNFLRYSYSCSTFRRSTTSPLNDFAEIEKEKAKWNFMMICKDLIVQKQIEVLKTKMVLVHVHIFFFFRKRGRIS